MLGTESPLFLIVAGAALLLAGRRLFWLFVGLVGFLTVFRWLAPHGIHANFRLLAALAAGVLGVLLAIFIQKVAVALAGFFAGGWAIAQLLGLHLQPARGIDLVLFVAAGVLAAILAVQLFDVALVILSSLAGASLLVDVLHPERGMRWIATLVLIGIGVAVQLRSAARRERSD